MRKAMRSTRCSKGVPFILGPTDVAINVVPSYDPLPHPEMIETSKSRSPFGETLTLYKYRYNKRMLILLSDRPDDVLMFLRGKGLRPDTRFYTIEGQPFKVVTLPGTNSSTLQTAMHDLGFDSYAPSQFEIQRRAEELEELSAVVVDALTNSSFSLSNPIESLISAYWRQPQVSEVAVDGIQYYIVVYDTVPPVGLRLRPDLFQAFIGGTRIVLADK
jgi:hypothetical protein